MAIEATFTATEDEFPLAAVFSEFPAAEIELDHVVPTDEFIVPYFWVRDVEIENLAMENVTHPGIHDIRVVDNVAGAAFIRIDWDLAYESVLTAIIETNVNLISALGSENQWSFDFRAESQEALADFQSYCRDHDIPLELTKLQALSPLESGQEYDLTDAQREAMTVAYTLGFYDSLREATRQDITNELGISPQAVGSRLQGGYGFILTDDGDLDDDEDVFFHMEDVGGEDLTEGTEVEFDIESSPKGPRAANVVRQ